SFCAAEAIGPTGNPTIPNMNYTPCRLRLLATKVAPSTSLMSVPSYLNGRTLNDRPGTVKRPRRLDLLGGERHRAQARADAVEDRVRKRRRDDCDRGLTNRLRLLLDARAYQVPRGRRLPRLRLPSVRWREPSQQYLQARWRRIGDMI